MTKTTVDENKEVGGKWSTLLQIWKCQEYFHKPIYKLAATSYLWQCFCHYIPRNIRCLSYVMLYRRIWHGRASCLVLRFQLSGNQGSSLQWHEPRRKCARAKFRCRSHINRPYLRLYENNPLCEKMKHFFSTQKTLVSINMILLVSNKKFETHLFWTLCNISYPRLLCYAA